MSSIEGRLEASPVSSVLIAAQEAPVFGELVSVQTAEINSGVATITGLSNKIAHAANKVAQRDPLEYSVMDSAALGLTLAGSVIGAHAMDALVDKVPEPVAFGVIAGTSVAGIATWFGASRAEKREVTFGIPDGYGLQCLRVGQPVGSMPQDKKVTVAVHPRTYTDELEPKGVTRARLAEALKVVSLAAGSSSNIGSVLIPSSVARGAGLVYEGKRRYRDVVDEISCVTTKIPYAEEEGAVIIPVDAVDGIRESLLIDETERLTGILAQLASRFPGKQEFLSVKNAALTKVLHGLIPRAVETGGFRTRGKDIRQHAVPVGVNGDGKTLYKTVNAWQGGIRTTTEGTFVVVDGSNKYDPSIIHRTQDSEVENRALRALTGYAQEAEGLGLATSVQEATSLELIRDALIVLEAKERAGAEAALQASKPALGPGGGTPRYIDAAPTKAEKRNMVGRLLARAAILGVVVGSMVVSGVAVADGFAVISSKPNAKAPVTQPVDGMAGMFRIESHGLDETGYWSREIGYNFYPRGSNTVAAGGWAPFESESVAVAAPNRLPDQSAPHLTVSTVSFSPRTQIPVREGLAVGAIRAFDYAGTQMLVRLFVNEEGLVIATTGERSDRVGYHRLEYDLIETNDPRWTVHPTRPARLTEDGVVGPMVYPGADAGVEAIASYISSNFTYDNRDVTHAAFNEHMHGPGELVRHVYDTERCQCAQCNTVAALVAIRSHPDANLAYVTGYTHDGKDEHGVSYLLNSHGHAWLNNGKIIDATASRLDENSAAPVKPGVAEANKQWDEQLKLAGLPSQEKPFPIEGALWPLLGAAAAGLVGIELRRRFMRNAVREFIEWDGLMTAAMDIDPRDAVKLLGWQAFGSSGSLLPVLAGDQTYNGELITNIPTETLQTVRRGGFRDNDALTSSQRRGLQHTAAAELRIRRSEARTKSRR